MASYGEEQELDLHFGESRALSAVKAFDAFPKTKPSYTQKTRSGGVWTVFLVCASVWLSLTELHRWWRGHTSHEFSVEQGVGHDLQINLDIVVAMKCDDLRVNVLDASGDHIKAGQALKSDATRWEHWNLDRRYRRLGSSKKERAMREAGYLMDWSKIPGLEEYGGLEYREEDVHDYLSAARQGGKKFAKTPKLSRHQEPNSCRIYGSMHLNKVQGDFHITARGHGYSELAQHLEHNAFNFSHHVNELSFGPFYPSLSNPLDGILATTSDNYYKFQYYLSIVPTVYTTDAKALSRLSASNLESPSSGSDGLDKHPHRYSRKTVFTNQYAVTEQSFPVPNGAVPGIFVKFDLEPIMLTIAEEWISIPALFIRLVNVVSGVLVAGGWCFQISEWFSDYRCRRGRSNTGLGVLDGALDEKPT
ncbi:DUF1692-domain-containing protein [Piedraia hortae CBS 480.64]|uniref:Endoplasmic reticulum-Golgi intermediate compartment protein n=1 Tax=Piedraia hortae CBS 480.64 TaxID=1314780 RepID=A0A6A7BU35_9PEZI|nr:DUF1692-domain-containing protein [Piedraia hortae CBS 480.64]